jgi:plastocyanin
MSTETLVTGAGRVVFQTPNEVHVNQIVVNSERRWSASTVDAYVGDTVVWSWNTNENVVESDSTSTPKAMPGFKSGDLAVKSSFHYQATQAGTYYFASENTASMNGQLVVKPRISMENGNLHIPGERLQVQ